MWLQLLASPLHILSSHRPRLTTSLHLPGPHGAPVAPVDWLLCGAPTRVLLPGLDQPGTKTGVRRADPRCRVLAAGAPKPKEMPCLDAALEEGSARPKSAETWGALPESEKQGPCSRKTRRG